MFNTIKTPRNYFTRELLHDSNVAFHCLKSLAAILLRRRQQVREEVTGKLVPVEFELYQVHMTSMN